MLSLRRQRKEDPSLLETTDDDDIRIMRIGQSGKIMGLELENIDRLWDTIRQIEKRCAKVLVIIVEPGHLSPENLDRFWTREREMMQEKRLTGWGHPLFLNDLAREGSAFRQLMEAVRSTDTFVITAISGRVDLHLFGAALACDWRTVGNDLILVNRTMKMGTPPGTAVPWFLAHYLGHGKAKQLLLQRGTIEVGEAYKLHLVDEVVPVDQLECSALETAKQFCEISDRELAAFKRAMVAADSDLSAYIDRAGLGFGFIEELRRLNQPSRRW